MPNGNFLTWTLERAKVLCTLTWRSSGYPRELTIDELRECQEENTRENERMAANGGGLQELPSILMDGQYWLREVDDVKRNVRFIKEDKENPEYAAEKIAELEGYIQQLDEILAKLDEEKS